MKKIFSLFLGLVMVFALLPMTAFAAEEYGVWVNGEQFTSEKSEITCGTGTATYDFASKTVTLTNATITNTITIADDGYDIISAIYSAHELTVDGDVTINTPEFGVYVANGNLTVNGNVTGVAGDSVLYAYGGDVTVNGDINLTHTKSNGNYPIFARYNVNITGSATITATESGSSSCAIYGESNITIGRDVTITGPFESGLKAANGSVKMKSGTWDIEVTNSYAILAMTGIDIPSTHVISIPESGAIVNFDTYYAVTEANLTTLAKHVVIEPKAPVTTGSITITKSFSGIDEDDRPINTATFTVESKDGTYTQTSKVGDREFASNIDDGQFVWKLNDVPAGTYTVTETEYDVHGYSCTVTYTVGTGDEQEGDTAPVTVVAGEELVITFVDTYAKDVTVTFEMNGHGTQVEAQTFASGEKATTPETPTADGYTFDGWYKDADLSNEFDFDSAITDNTVVYAKWTEKTTSEDENQGGNTNPGDDVTPPTDGGETKPEDKPEVKPEETTKPTEENKPGTPAPAAPAPAPRYTSPNTGDNTASLAMLAVVSGIALCGTFGAKKRTKK